MCVDVAALFKSISFVFLHFRIGCLEIVHNFKGCLDWEKKG